MSRRDACSRLNGGFADGNGRGNRSGLTGLQPLGLNHGAMKRAMAERFEMLGDGFASVSFGGAVGLFVYHLLEPMTDQPAPGACAAAAAAAAYALSRLLLSLVESDFRKFSAADGRVNAEPESGTDMRPDSPVVVQLFVPAAAAASSPSTVLSPAARPDASESLHEALNQLRESLANRR